jgi:gamma-glutamyl-gamma-aminobutyrate hydrolase PuuD
VKKGVRMKETTNKAVPLIGVVLSTSVEGAIFTAGAEVVSLDGRQCEIATIKHLDGLILSGGGDVDPRRYTAEPVSKEVYGIDQHRDVVEFAMVEEALKHKVPIMGICRGAQVLNVAKGGTLFQDIPDDHFGFTMWLKFLAKSRLGRHFGTRMMPQSTHYHHQAVKDVGKGLRAIAWASDGTIEAIESVPGAETYVLGTQFHPEMDCHSDEQNNEIFKMFTWDVAARKAHRQKEPATTRYTKVLDMIPVVSYGYRSKGITELQTGYELDALDWDDPWCGIRSESEAEKNISYDKAWAKWYDTKTGDWVNDSFGIDNDDDEQDYFDYAAGKWTDGEFVSDNEAQTVCDMICEGKEKCPCPFECLLATDCLAGMVARQSLALKRGNPGREGK